MDGQVRQWRRLLHEFDPDVIAAKANGTYVPPSASAAAAAAAAKVNDESASASEAEMVDKSESEESFVMVAGAAE